MLRESILDDCTVCSARRLLVSTRSGSCPRQGARRGERLVLRLVNARLTDSALVPADVQLGDGRDLREQSSEAALALSEPGAYLVIARAGALHASGLVLVSDRELEVPREFELRAHLGLLPGVVDAFPRLDRLRGREPQGFYGSGAGDRPARWAAEGGGWLQGYFAKDNSDEFHAITGVDAEHQLLQFDSHAGIRPQVSLILERILARQES